VSTRNDNRLQDEPGIRFGLGNGALIVTVMACVVLRLNGMYALMALGAVVVLATAAAPVAVGVLLGSSSWAFYTGFVENAYGQLSFHPADLARLAALVVCGFIAARLSGGRARAPRPLNTGGSP
jgi:hypothetical protein